MPDALLDIIGVVPVQLVFAYALTKMLNIRRLSLFWVLELVFVLLISSFRSSMSVEFRLAASVPLALIPIFLSQGSLARRILVVTLAHLVLFFAELPGGALWMSMTGTPVADYEAVRTFRFSRCSACCLTVSAALRNGEWANGCPCFFPWYSLFW